MRSLPSRFKEWIAERIANNMIDSQLAEMNSDIETESEISVSLKNQTQEELRKFFSLYNVSEKCLSRKFISFFSRME